jgi:N4-(beta-N-acetylglucosaminyl)-L-asparaginase
VIAATWSWGRPLCERARDVLREGGSVIDAIERGINVVELDPSVRTVGLGGYPNEAGVVQLDAMMMDGARLEAGAVGALEDVPLAISVARRVMERTRHVYLMGEGAKRFALEQGFEERALLTDEARREWEAWVAEGTSRFRRDAPPRPSDRDHDTVGAIGTDGRNTIVGVSTSGLAYKMAGRVGDSPIVGSGGYADSDVGAACATGVGEEIIRVSGSFAIVELMRAGRTPREAIDEVLDRIRRKRGDLLGDAQVAFIAMRTDGELAHGALRPGFEVAILRGGEVTTEPIR